MVRITEELVRKRSEHNEGIIGTLEELSLHQEDIEKIENLNNWCKELQILYLQANLISKIENLNKLKKLQYLNLAVNNIEVIENLERCESLLKLDLTLNFIGKLHSVCSLKDNYNLTDLHLTGNPCTEYNGYRQYVIAQLPQLERLDAKEITKSERIKALQILPQIEKHIHRQEDNYSKFREEQLRRVSSKNSAHLTDEEFWKTSSENCPETRVEIANRQRKCKNNDNVEPVPKKSVTLFNKHGKPLNINQAKLNFTFNDADPKQYVLDIEVYKFMDSNLIDVDLQPIYVKVTIKGKIFQIVFPEEIQTDKSTAQRSQVTGHLVLVLPKVNYKATITKTIIKKNEEKRTEHISKNKNKQNKYLEVEENTDMDFSKIIEKNREVEDLYNDLEIPPLEYF